IRDSAPSAAMVSHPFEADPSALLVDFARFPSGIDPRLGLAMMAAKLVSPPRTALVRARRTLEAKNPFDFGDGRVPAIIRNRRQEIGKWPIFSHDRHSISQPE